MEISELSANASGSNIDRTQLEAMGRDMPEMLLGILKDFESSFREELEGLMDPSRKATSEEWRGYLHRAKGSGGTLGLAGLQAECARWEDSAKAGNLPDITELEDLDSLFERSCQEAREFLEALVK